MFEWKMGVVNNTPFVMIDSDGNELAGLTVAVKLLKPGQTTAINGGGTVTEVTNMTGWYVYTSLASEADTTGMAALQLTATGAIQQNIPVQIGSIGTWSDTPRTLTQSIVSIASVLAGNELSLYRGTRWSVTFNGIDTDNLTNVFFTIKENETLADKQALVQISSAIGLLVINRQDAATAANGSIDIGSGTITITLLEAETSKLGIHQKIDYDLKGVYSTSGPLLLSDGRRKANILPDISRSY